MAPEDASAFYRLNSHPDVMRFTGESPVGSVAEARNALVNYPDFEEVGFGRWGCVRKGQAEIIGFCGLKYLEDLDVVDVGFRFFPEFWGRGFATEACRACVQFGFDMLSLEQIVGFVLPQNGASVRVLEKTGMTLEGEVEFDGLRPLKYAIQRGESGELWRRSAVQGRVRTKA